MDGMILYAAADLLWATRIKGACDSLGVPARPVRSVEMLEARLADSDVRGLIVDLETGPLGLDLIRRARAAADAARPFTVLCFGPHVDVERFEQARAAGADRAMARGAFADRLPQIVVSLERGDDGAGRDLSGAAPGIH